MSLKQSVVIVNQYTIKTGSGGSRGGTPGNYVLNYMARDQAVEDLTPVRLEDQDAYIVRYMARKEATETLDSVPEIKKAMRQAQGYGGVAFGYGDVSLSHEKLMECSKDIQDNFDKGKTVMKTVLSFSHDYLKERGVVPPDFQCNKRGDYRGNLDQMKLRMAIMTGLESMARGSYDDLKYVGVIQVDTEHVHCHLAMVDRGKGRLAEDGTQRGKITDKMKVKLRRGLDNFLDEHAQVKQLYSNISQDMRNAVCYIKKFTHKTMERQGLPQFLVACLPDDRRLWRAGTNRKEMRKPNYIVREYVKGVLAQPNSGYKETLRGIDKSARRRQKQEGLTHKQYRQIYKQGQEKVIQDCMNGVYSILRQIPDRAKKVRTPMMTVMAQSYEDMAAELGSDPIVEFGFKLRSYSTRLDHHKKETHRYREAVDFYAKQDVSEDAKPLMDFLRFELDYNDQLMSKYQHFLQFLPPSEEYEDDFIKIVRHKNKMTRLAKLRADPSCKRMTPTHAEEYGRKVYETTGGQFVRVAPEVLERRQEVLEDQYQAMLSDFRDKLADAGMRLDSNPDDDGDLDEMAIVKQPRYPFHDVKALDLHHLQLDFPGDVEVSRLNIDHFVETSKTRYTLYQQAKSYLIRSGQGELVDELPGKDVETMKALSDRIEINPVLPSVKPVKSGVKSGKTVPLDADYKRDIDLMIKMTIESSLELDRTEGLN